MHPPLTLEVTAFTGTLPASAPGTWDNPIVVDASGPSLTFPGYTSGNVQVCSSSSGRAVPGGSVTGWQASGMHQLQLGARRAPADGCSSPAPAAPQAFHPEPPLSAAWRAPWLDCGLNQFYPRKLGVPAGSDSGVLSRQYVVWRLATGADGLPAEVTADFCAANGTWLMVNHDTVLTALISDSPDGSSGLTCLGRVPVRALPLLPLLAC